MLSSGVGQWAWGPVCGPRWCQHHLGPGSEGEGGPSLCDQEEGGGCQEAAHVQPCQDEAAAAGCHGYHLTYMTHTLVIIMLAGWMVLLTAGVVLNEIHVTLVCVCVCVCGVCVCMCVCVFVFKVAREEAETQEVQRKEKTFIRVRRRKVKVWGPEVGGGGRGMVRYVSL